MLSGHGARGRGVQMHAHEAKTACVATMAAFAGPRERVTQRRDLNTRTSYLASLLTAVRDPDRSRSPC